MREVVVTATKGPTDPQRAGSDQVLTAQMIREQACAQPISSPAVGLVVTNGLFGSGIQLQGFDAYAHPVDGIIGREGGVIDLTASRRGYRAHRDRAGRRPRCTAATLAGVVNIITKRPAYRSCRGGMRYETRHD
jgi:hypothetical protein